MYGEWLRLTPAELERAKADTVWLTDLSSKELGRPRWRPGDTDLDIPERRRFGTDKTWHALDYLLTRRDFPVGIIYGEEEFEPPFEWGYGSPMYLPPERVRTAAAALAPLSEADLLDGVDHTDLLVEDIYPSVWDRPDELDWAVCFLPYVKVYFDAAAESGDAIVCWIG